MPINVRVTNSGPQRISVTQQQRTGVRQIGISPDGGDDIFVGGGPGLVPANTAGNGSYLLSASGQWVAPSAGGGGGGGTSSLGMINVAAGNALVATGNPLTQNGTITIAANNATVAQNGATRLYDSPDSTDVFLAATANVVNAVHNRVVTAEGSISTVDARVTAENANLVLTNANVATVDNRVTQGTSNLVLTNANVTSLVAADVVLAANIANLRANLIQTNSNVASLNTGLVLTNQNVAALNAFTNVAIVLTNSNVAALNTGLVLTNQNVASLNSFVNVAIVLTNSNVAALNTGLVLTNQNVAALNAFTNVAIVLTNSNVAALNTGLVLTNQNVAALNAFTNVAIVLTNSNVAALNTGLVLTNSNVAALNAFVNVAIVLTNSNVGALNTGLVLTNQNVIALNTVVNGKVSNTRAINTTSPLAGGGDLTQDRTITIQSASTTQNGEVRLNDTTSSQNNFQAATANVANILARPYTGTFAGLVPANTAGNGTYVLNASGQWVPPGSGGGGGSGTVTSVAVSVGTGLNVESGSPVTTSGTIVITANAASTTVNGVVRLNDTLASQNTGQALTANMGFYVTQLLAGKVQNTRSIATTSPLSGGGDLTSDRTLSIQAASTTQNGEVRLNDTLVSANIGQALTANMGSFLDTKKVNQTRTINTTAPLAGGGDLTSDRTLTITAASTTQNGEVRLNDTVASQNIGQALTANMGRYIAVELLAGKVQNTRSVLAGSALGGGGTLAGDVTLFAQNASTSVNGVVRLQDSLVSQNTGQALTANMGFYVTQILNGKVQNTVAINTTSPLSGGGDLSTSRTLTIQAASTTQNGEVRLNDSIASQNVGQAATANMARYIGVELMAGKVQNTRTVSTTTPLAGGGALSGDLSITIQAASTTQNGEVRLNDTLSSRNVGQALTANMGAYIVEREATFVANTRAINTTSPLTGGGNLTSDRTIAIQAASTTQNGEVRLNDTTSSQNSGQAATANVANILARPYSGTYAGLVPANTAGNGQYLLNASGAWVPPGGGGAGSGTVTSVAIETGQGLNVESGSPVTTSGTIRITANDASTSVNGVVRLNDSVASRNTGQALTANMGFYVTELLSGKVQNTRSVLTSSPLGGGGTLAGDLTITIQSASISQNGEVRLNDTLVSANIGQALTANMGSFLDTKKVNQTRTISTTAPLTGGGDLTSDRTLAITAASTTQNGEVRLNDTLTSQNTGQALTANMGFYVTQVLTGKVQNTVAINTTSPLAGGGDLSTSRTLTIQAASTTQNGEVRLNDTMTSQNTGQAATANMNFYIAQLLLGKVQNTRSVGTTSPLSGGGALSGDLTIAIQAASTTQNGEVRLNDTMTSQNVGQAGTANMNFYIAQLLLGKVQNTRSVLTAGGGITGGGTLAGDLTLVASNASTSVNGVVRLNDSLTSQNVGQAGTANMNFYIAQLLLGKVQNTISVSTTSPLTGGGDLSASRTLAIQAASTTQNGEVRLNDSLTSQNTGQALTANMGFFLSRAFTTAANGMVPAPLSVAGRVLSDNGAWISVGGTGTVTSVDVNTGHGLANAGGPIVGTGSITLSLVTFTDVARGAVPASGGGTTNFLRADGTWAEPVGGSPSGGADLGVIIAVQRGYFL